jgi:hypothetical protein
LSSVPSSSESFPPAIAAGGLHVRLNSSDIKHLCQFPALRELDLAGCVIGDAAVPYLQKMQGLTKLTIWKAGISDEGAERIDDALPNCRVIY